MNACSDDMARVVVDDTAATAVALVSIAAMQQAQVVGTDLPWLVMVRLIWRGTTAL